jgi:hypothetical protein
MPPTDGLKNGHLKPVPAARRKSKPTFDIPVVAGEPGAPAGWVYRDSASAAPATPTQGGANSAPRSNRFLSTGIGLFVAGAAPLAFISLLAIGLVATPFLLAKSTLTS